MKIQHKIKKMRLAAELHFRFFIIISLILLLPSLAFAQPYSPLSLDGTWTTASSTGFTPRYGLSSCVLDGKIYVIGGADTSGFLNTLEVFDPVTNTWKTPVTNGTFAPHYGHTSCTFNSKIYVIGGAYGSIQDQLDSSVAIFDPSMNTWSNLYDTTGGFTRRFDLTSCVLNGKIYVIGGELAPYWLTNAIEIFDPINLSWSKPLFTESLDTLRPVLTPTSHVINDKIYVLGLRSSADSGIIVQVFDPLTNSWKTSKTTGTPPWGALFASSEINGKIYVMGGADYRQGGKSTNDVKVFDPSANIWSTPVTTGTFTARDYLTSSAVDGGIYAMGGGAVPGNPFDNNKNEVFTPAASGVMSVGTFPDLKLFPNPTDGIINVQNVSSNTKQAAIINMLGETVMEIPNLNTANFTLDLSKLPSGIYYARFTTSNSVMIKKIVRY